MARHEPAAWVCHECPRDANVSVRLPDGRRVHLCPEHRDVAVALFVEAQLGDPDVRYLGARRGHCQICGCTDARACAGGCSWSNRERTFCSRCADLARELEHLEGVLEDMVSQGLLRKVSP
jgi:hypothetical protein